MHDEFLARIMTALDLEFKRVLHYYDVGYDSDNYCRLPCPFMRPVFIYLVSITKVSLKLTDYKGAQGPTSPSTPSVKVENVKGVCWNLTPYNG